MLVMARAGYHFGDYVSPQNLYWNFQEYNGFEVHPTLTIEYESPP